MSEPLTPAERDEFRAIAVKAVELQLFIHPLGLYARRFALRLLDERDALEQRNTKILEENEDLGIERDTLRAQLEQLTADFRTLEPCGHPKNFAIGDEHGHFSCVVCRCEKLELDREHAIDFLKMIRQASMGVPDQFGVDSSGYCNLSDCDCSNHLAVAALAALSEPTTSTTREAKP